MKIFECKCGSKEVFIDKVGNNTGLYCCDCGKWITWLNKDQIRLAERQIANSKPKEIFKALVTNEFDTVCNVLDEMGITYKNDKGYLTLLEVFTNIQNCK